MKLVLVALLAVAFTTTAQAKHRNYTMAHPDCNVLWPCEGVVNSHRGEIIAKKLGIGGPQKHYIRHTHRVPVPLARRAPTGEPSRVAATVLEHPAGCPHTAFCGCGAAVRIFGAPIRSLWLAANWFAFPRTEPAPGMAAVRRHHVFVLERHIAGNVWLSYDANSGHHRTQMHARSIAGYVIVNPHAARVVDDDRLVIRRRKIGAVHVRRRLYADRR